VESYEREQIAIAVMMPGETKKMAVPCRLSFRVEDHQLPRNGHAVAPECEVRCAAMLMQR
jgi:hypothetical protein